MSESNLMDVVMSIRVESALQDLQHLRGVLKEIILLKERVENIDTDEISNKLIDLMDISEEGRIRRVETVEETQAVIEQETRGQFREDYETIIDMINEAKGENLYQIENLGRQLDISEEEAKDLYRAIRQNILSNILELMENEQYSSEEFKKYRNMLETFTDLGPADLEDEFLDAFTKSLSDIKMELLGTNVLYKTGKGEKPLEVLSDEGEILGYVSAEERRFKRPRIPSPEEGIMTEEELGTIRPFELSEEREMEIQRLLVERPEGYTKTSVDIIQEQIKETGKIGMQNFLGLSLPFQSWKEMIKNAEEFFEDEESADMFEDLLEDSSNTLRLILNANEDLDEFIEKLSDLGINQEFLEDIRDELDIGPYESLEDAGRETSAIFDILGRSPKFEEIIQSAVSKAKVLKVDVKKILDDKINVITKEFGAITTSNISIKKLVSDMNNKLDGLRKSIKSDMDNDTQDIGIALSSLKRELQRISNLISDSVGKMIF